MLNIELSKFKALRFRDSNICDNIPCSRWKSISNSKYE